MNGKQELYVAMLKKFSLSQGLTVEKIRSALDTDDLITAERLAHTLKGLSGNIGAHTLQKLAEDLETAIHTNETSEKLNAILAHIAQRLSELITALELYFEPVETSAIQPQTIDRTKLETVLSKLAALLNDDNAESNDYFAEHAILLNSTFPEQFISLQKSVDNYDFANALNTLKQLTAQWKITC
jgi:two-component system sensor histidine kinase/response regulator